MQKQEVPGNSPLTPPIDNSRNPPLLEMDWASLERLTADLYAEEPGVVATDEYGTAGQVDYGADVLARLNDGRRDAVLCKRGKQSSAADITAWGALSLEHGHDGREGLAICARLQTAAIPRPHPRSTATSAAVRSNAGLVA